MEPKSRPVAVRVLLVFGPAAGIVALFFAARVGLGDRMLGLGKVWMDGGIPVSERSVEAVTRVRPQMERELAARGLAYGAPIFTRIFKESKELELWVQAPARATYVLFRTYQVRNVSGKLGTKTREGDWQAPEGFYQVAAGQLNPLSRFHLSFNIGYPNKYDRAHDYTGSAIMVHGGGASIGCFAMGDEAIEEIYALAEAALRGGQKAFAVHVFPFRITDEAMNAHEGSEWMEFWRDLRDGYDRFEATRVPPTVDVAEGRYVILPEQGERRLRRTNFQRNACARRAFAYNENLILSCFRHRIRRVSMAKKHYILGVHITNRVKRVPDVQAALTKFGCHIRTRVGLHGKCNIPSVN